MVVDAGESTDAGQAESTDAGQAESTDAGQAESTDAGQAESTDAGQATVELVLVLPVLVTLMLAVVQVGLIGRDQLLIWHAARESARAAAIDPIPATARAAALDATSGLDPPRLTVTLSGGSNMGELTTVSLRYRSPTEVPLVGHLIDDVNLTAGLTMRVE